MIWNRNMLAGKEVDRPDDALRSHLKIRMVKRI